MALIIMNDNKCYITLNETGRLRKTFNIEEAKIYETLEKAVEQCRHNPKSTKGYYVYDTATNKISG